MPLPNGLPGVVTNPLNVSPYTQPMTLGVDFPPPGSSFIITETDNKIITENGNFMITE